jgi:hypothetical protein
MTDPETRASLRRMVREILQEFLPRDLAATPTVGAYAGPSEPSSQSPDVRHVRVGDDRDLADVVTQVLNLAEDPARAADLRSGRIRFALLLDRAADSASAPGPIEVERGAVTERLVQRAAREQRRLRLGPRAVVTPLARDRARALGVALDRTTDSSTNGKDAR